jgi:cytochrome c biogenesis protein CcmG, thiol:disulfide interchange protein DsbE
MRRLRQRWIDTPRPGLRAVVLLSAALSAMLLTSCGSSASEEGGYGGGHPDYGRALAGSPGPLAALHAQHDRLLLGGDAAFQKRIAALRGYPAVVNVWASWCWPCRGEFPVLQKLSAKYGRRVAFLGVDSEDSNAAASTFLRERPVPYPSYADPGKQIAAALHVGFGIPDTAFYDRQGKLVYLKQGPYAHPSDLEADLKRYALG